MRIADKPREVLLIGNGFDMAHGLPTDYQSFLSILKRPQEFYEYFCAKNKGEILVSLDADPQWESILWRPENMDTVKIKDMINKMLGNSWAKYYANCNAEIDGWVDFEREMIPVLSFFNEIIEGDCSTFGYGSASYGYVSSSQFGLERIARLWKSYIRRTSLQGRVENELSIEVESKYVDYQYGIIRRKMVEDFWEEWETFVSCFITYLQEIAIKRPITPVNLFKSISVTDVITFNYTPVISDYWKLYDADIDYVHGSVERNAIMGVNQVQNDPDNFFKIFEKGYQRVVYELKPLYRRIIKEKDYNLTIYGHSLDTTDKSILEPLIRNANKTTIYCYVDPYGYSDRKTKIMNLMIMLGDGDAGEMLDAGKIKLKEHEN